MEAAAIQVMGYAEALVEGTETDTTLMHSRQGRYSRGCGKFFRGCAGCFYSRLLIALSRLRPLYRNALDYTGPENCAAATGLVRRAQQLYLWLSGYG